MLKNDTLIFFFREFNSNYFYFYVANQTNTHDSSELIIDSSLIY
jgi:hypothetical protein